MSELIVSGDSWSFGSEIVDPSFKNKDIIDWDACNDEYRTSNIWPNILSNESLDIDVASTNDSTLNDIPTENLIDNLDISTLENVIL